MPNHTIIEFQDAHCRVFHWEQTRNTFVLQRALTVPFGEPAASPGIPSKVESISGYARLKTPEGAREPEPGIEMTDSQVQEANGLALRKALRQAGLHVKEALAVVPKHWATLRVVTLPSSAPDEIAEMARFEAERHIPFNVERHVIAHRVISSEKLQGSRVALAALDRPPATQITATFDAAGLRLAGIDVSTIALVNALLHSGAWDTEATETVAHVNVGSSNTDIIILNQGEPIFARSTTVGAEKLTETTDDAPESPEPDSRADLDAVPVPAEGARYRRIVREVRQTLEYARREFDCGDLATIFLSGSGAQLPGLERAFAHSFGTTIQVLDPFARQADGGPVLQLGDASGGLDLAPSAYALAAGALVRQTDESKLRINLVPDAYLKTHARLRRKKTFTLASLVLAAVLVGGLGLTSHILTLRKSRLAQIESQIEAQRDRATEIKYRRTVLDILVNNTSQQNSALAVLDTISRWRDLFTTQQMRISISSFSFSDRDQLKIEGYSRSYAELNALVERLSDSGGHFQFVRIERQPMESSRNNPQIKVVHFTLICQFKTG
jgi:type IV pilus assembly protein PilM